MKQHAVCLTFDFDAMSVMIARDLKSPTPISRGEFGAVAVGRILALLEKYRLKASWFVPGTIVKTYPDHVRRIVDAGHEVGNHGWTHVPPASLSPEQEEEGLLRANEAIAEIAGRNPRGYRSPSFDLSPVTVDLLLKHGFVYESSMMGHDHHPYFARHNDIVSDHEPIVFGETTNLIEMPVSWSLDDYPHFEFMRTKDFVLPGLQNAGLVLENWVEDFDYMKRTEEWGVLTYTFHPFVSGRGHRMILLERLICSLLERGAHFVTLEEAALEFRTRSASGVTGK